GDSYTETINKIDHITATRTEIINGECFEITYCLVCDGILDTQTIDPVAQNTVSGQYYTTFEKALEEAAAGDTVKLLANVEVENLVATTEGYIDLNGYTLEAYMLSMGMSTHIVDSSEGNLGYLVVGSAGQKINSSNCDMPVYVGYTAEDGTVKDAYRFFDGILLQQLTPTFSVDEKTGSKFVSVTFRHILGDAATTKALFGDGASDNNIQLGVKCTVTKADGTTTEELYVYCSDELIKSVYTNNKAFIVTITGLEAYDTITIGSFIMSKELGVEITSCEKNGEIYSTIGTYKIETGTLIEA
ncbi:MAG: hypothetical protein IKU19_09730, partial [Clostridia bacterium]|nr:hypothetical protein [Clostridia bacterium]